MLMLKEVQSQEKGIFIISSKEINLKINLPNGETFGSLQANKSLTNDSCNLTLIFSFDDIEEYLDKSFAIKSFKV